MSNNPVFARLDGERTSIVWMQHGDALNVLYLGARLDRSEILTSLAHASACGRHENQPDVPPTGGLLPDVRTGWRGPTLIEISREGNPVQPNWGSLRLEQSQQEGDLVAIWLDDALGLELRITWSKRAGDVIAAQTTITGAGKARYSVERCASLLLPLPSGFDHVTHFAGRWADDMRAERLPITRAGLSWASRGGKSAFAGGDWLIFDDERSGGRMGFHIAWSGDHATQVERNEDGLVTLVGEVPLGPTDNRLEAGEWNTPEALFAWAEDDDTLTKACHDYALNARPRTYNIGPNPDRVRKVHFNTWEACAFDFEQARLMGLAGEAAALGAERFVLDDGWFKGRSSDSAGLGDWTADPIRFPRGLDPLIEHVKSLGMDFGLWVEPEMVSPNSDLYREYPEWCIHEEGHDRLTERGQLVLDLTIPDAREYVYENIARLLTDHDIAYLKWDHNRRLFPSGSGPAQVEALHAIWGRLRSQFPDLMIESCSSGGGRIDMAIIGLCERFWPSDNNDPIERVRIMREWSRLLPLAMLGNHVGPSPNPITGRRTDMDFRAKVALFGHMGVEADPGAMSEEDRAVLAAHITLYKEWRRVQHSGALYHLDHPDAGIFAQMVVEETRALAIAAQTTFSATFDAAPVRLKGLDPDAFYRVTLPLPWPARAAHYLPGKRDWRDGFTLSGRTLMTKGLALPLTHPETAWIIALERLA